MFVKTKKIIYFLISLSLLFLGGIIYIRYRSHSLNMFGLLRALNLEKFFPQHYFNKNSIIQSFIVFSLPNGLWYLSAIMIFSLIWKQNKPFYFYSTIFLIFNILTEVLQLNHIVSGTFDSVDIFVLVISHFMGLTINYFWSKGVMYEKESENC